MPEIKKFRLGGAAGYSIVAYGSKTRAGVVYERIELVDECDKTSTDVTQGCNPMGLRPGCVVRLSCTTWDFQHLLGLLTEARKHLAMGVK